MSSVPSTFDDDEIILRSIFSKMVLKDPKKPPGVRANAFNPYPREKGEISVNRLDYTDENFCKEWSKESINIDDEYHGFASIYCKIIRSTGADIEYTPLANNIVHSDIKLGYEVQKGEPLPTKVNQIKTDLAKKSTLHTDVCPLATEWCGGKIIPDNN